MKKDLPAMPFYIGDWKKDPAVQVLSREEKMIWLEIIMLMWESEERGYLTINKLPITNDMLSIALNLVNQRLTSTLTKFRQLGLFSVRAHDKAIFSRKIIKILELSAKRTKTGSLGGNPNLVNQRLTKQSTKGLTKGLTKGKADGLPNAENENETLISTNNVVNNINTNTNINLEERKSCFYKKVIEFEKKYSKEMCVDFYDWWTEHDENGKKLRFEMQNIFNISKRLARWKNNQRNFNSSKKQTDKKINIDTIDHDTGN